MSNRKERRAAKKSSTEIPLAQPPRDQRKAKTLLDIAAERNAELQGGQPFIPTGSDKSSEPQYITKTIHPDGSLSDSDAVAVDDDLIGPFGNAIFYAISLTMLHLTLDVLVHNQYAETIKWDAITRRTMTTFPSLMIMLYFLHPRAGEHWAQAVFLIGSIVAGCYLSWASSEQPFFAVMKVAPPLGTLWVWFVLELRLELAMASLFGVGGYFWWKGYTIY
jgi:hypothetical protein